MTVIDRTRARTDLAGWLGGSGMPPPAAETVVDHVLAAERVGRGSHGLRLLPRIARNAGTHDGTEVVVDEREPGTLVVDAVGLPGIHALHRAVDEVIRCRSTGRHVVTVAVTGFTGTTGCLGLFAHRIARSGATGLVTATSRSIMAPPGTATPLLGTNALALASPVDGGAPLVVDCSSSATSFGDVALARLRGEQLPEGVALDRSGAATTDPWEVIDGSLLPSGGHRGWSQALVVEVLAGAVVGGKVGRADGGESALVLAVGPESFGGSPPAALRILVDQITASEPGPGGVSAHVPGGRFELVDRPWAEVEVETAVLEGVVAAGGPRLDR
ncbi:MAG: Ldh family oxidoreductase [Acidobacteria bacterium]|nr:Ldh family oxidoreductase [Acidobacteriota bacterium]